MSSLSNYWQLSAEECQANDLEEWIPPIKNMVDFQRKAAQKGKIVLDSYLYLRRALIENKKLKEQIQLLKQENDYLKNNNSSF